MYIDNFFSIISFRNVFSSYRSALKLTSTLSKHIAQKAFQKTF